MQHYNSIPAQGTPEFNATCEGRQCEPARELAVDNHARGSRTDLVITAMTCPAGNPVIGSCRDTGRQEPIESERHAVFVSSR